MKNKEILQAVWEMVDRLTITYSRQEKLELLETLHDEAERRALQVENAMDQLGEASEFDLEEEWQDLEKDGEEDD